MCDTETAKFHLLTVPVLFLFSGRDFIPASFHIILTNLHSVGDVISAHGGDGGVVLLWVVVVMVMMLAEGVGHGAAEAVVAQEAHQRVAFAGRDAVAGEGGGGAGGVRGGAQPELQGGGERAQRQLAGGGTSAGLQACGGGAQGGVTAAAVAIGG